MNKKELWIKLENYHFDKLVPTKIWDEIKAKFGGSNPFTKAFADKLSKKYNWNKNKALKSIWEYKKFVYLGVISDFSVTPSKVIDQVWHEHLLFTAGYRKFCNEIIQYNFDHSPELTYLESQPDKYMSQFFHTIELYRVEFGHEPPGEIWGNLQFDQNIENSKLPKKNQNEGSDVYYNYEDAPIVANYQPNEKNGFEFGGGGFGGGGTGGNWDEKSDSNSDDSSDNDSSSCGSDCGGD